MFNLKDDVMRNVVNVTVAGWGMLAVCGCVLHANKAESMISEENFADSLPVLKEVGIDNPVTFIKDSVNGMSRFYYETGRMTGGDCGHYGRFTVCSNPLSIEVRRHSDVRDDCVSYDARYENVCMDDSGHIVSMEMTATNFSPNSSFVNSSIFHIGYSMSYKNGYIRDISYQLRDEKGNNEKGKVVYTWNEGDLNTMVFDIQRMFHVYEEHVSHTYLYERNSPNRAVSGVFVHDTMGPPYLHEFIWYTGMLGKPLKRLPDCVRVEQCGDCGSKEMLLKRDVGDTIIAKSLIYTDGSIVGYSYGVCP